MTTRPSSAPSAPVASSAAERTAWPPIVALAAGIGALVASEFLPASVLPAMAADLGVSEGTAGLAVAATAIAGAVTAPSIAVLLPRTDRRTVLVGLLVAAVVANLAVAVAPGFGVLLLGRLVLGIAIAGYWSFAFGAGTHAVPGRDHFVSTSIALGVTLATIAGVPLASLAGDAVGWRAVFAGATVVSALSAIALAVTLPSVPAHPSAGFAMLRRAVANRRLMTGALGVVLVAFGNFAAYPYIRIVIEKVDPGSTTWLLLAWGVGGMAGNLAAGRFAGRLRVVVAAAPLLLGASLLLTLTATAVPFLAVAVVLWGVAFNAVPVATQLWVTRVEPERTESAIALQVTAFQVAITLGSASGGVLLDAHGVTAALVLGAVAAVASGLLFALLRVPRG
ncbi:DHA1 family purine ribonucleoside efflux pump-like MFS transporter [Actinocorallia herbida]|uniref:DHA1 family purine ribonucleoside efflux pump-like MFS transporter n=1 Tax=Actinocorallia herbida TaxID=58109 RepID=A0A3N1CWZ7_9ACTN|nr:MFS transporter [Actinocorallia herbida]ROO85755.1 DHA1 family purine ribonucleoside efflux pump-like MFS transporter [Actinocorallia herbida]